MLAPWCSANSGAYRPGWVTEAPLFAEHQGANIGTLWDIHIDDLIPSRAYRRVHYGEA